MKFKRTLLGLGTITMVIAPISSIVACGSSENKGTFVSKDEMAALNKHEFTHKEDTFDLKKFDGSDVIKDATIVSWIDGDTPIVDYKDNKGMHIRITSIDTPELHVEGSDGKINVETTGNEYTWAMRAKAFGEKAMPVGTHVKLYTTGSKSYERTVGSLFYPVKDKPGQYKNFSVEMLRNGLATAFVSDISTAVSSFSILGYTGLALADAYNYALKTGAGLFGAGIYKILGIHGVTSDVTLRWTGKKYDPYKYGSTKNIYDVLKAV